jgi:hypothetical protein
MATTSDVKVSAGTGTNIATYDITEDAETKKLQRVVLSTNAGADIDFTAASPVTQSGTWNVGLSAGTSNIGKVDPAGRTYKTVAASQTASVLQVSTGATGDVLDGVLVIPATTSPGNVLVLDNATSITVFTGGASSVSNLVPFYVPVGASSVSGAWKITTGANVSVVAIGKFS